MNAVSGSYNGVGTIYVASVSYWPHGAPNNTVYGNTLNVVAAYFNKELQVTGMWHVIAGNPNEFLWLEYPNWALPITTAICKAIPNMREGRRPGQRCHTTAGYGYDTVNRLSTASETETVNNQTSNTWSRTFNYDPFGNPPAV